jgi:hypothetical protein
MKNLGATKLNLLPFVMRNFNFVGFLVGWVKEVFLFLSKTKSYLSEGRRLFSRISGGKEKKN